MSAETSDDPAAFGSAYCLAGRVAIITGAGRGLGRAFALETARHGANIIVNDIDIAEAKAVVGEISCAGGTALASGHSVADPAQASALVEMALGRFGRIDGLVNNAAVHHIRSIEQEDFEQVRWAVDTNLLGAIHCTHAALPALKDCRGAVVNITSSASLGLAGRGAYAATKAGLLSFTYSWALELEEAGVRVNAIAPRAATRLTGQTRGELEPPEAVAPVLVYLLSDLSRPLTGQCIRAAGSDVAWLIPARHGPTFRRDSPGVLGVGRAIDALGEPPAFGFHAAEAAALD